MTSNRMQVARIYVKRRSIAAISAVLIYLGTLQIVSAIRYPIGNLMMQVANLVIENAFRDRMLLRAPVYSFFGLHATMAREIAVGVMGIVIGTFVSLLADLKRRTAAE